MSRIVHRSFPVPYASRPIGDLSEHAVDMVTRIKRAWRRACSVSVVLASGDPTRRYAAVLWDLPHDSGAGRLELHGDAAATPEAALELLLQDDLPGYSVTFGHRGMVARAQAASAAALN